MIESSSIACRILVAQRPNQQDYVQEAGNGVTKQSEAPFQPAVLDADCKLSSRTAARCPCMAVEASLCQQQFDIPTFARLFKL